MNDEYGDKIKCTNCGQVSEIELGGNVCPKCGSEGTNVWAEEL